MIQEPFGTEKVSPKEFARQCMLLAVQKVLQEWWDLFNESAAQMTEREVAEVAAGMVAVAKSIERVVRSKSLRIDYAGKGEA